MTDNTYFLLVHYPHDAVFILGKWQVIRYGLNPNRPHLAPEYSEGTPYNSAEEAMVAAYAAGASRIWKTGNYCHPWWVAWEGTRRQNATPEKLAAAEVADHGFVESLEEIETIAEPRYNQNVNETRKQQTTCHSKRTRLS